MPPLSPSFSTGMLLRSNSVTSRSAKRESCGYFTADRLDLAVRVTKDGGRQRIVVVLVAVAHVAAIQDRRVIQHGRRFLRLRQPLDERREHLGVVALNLNELGLLLRVLP